MRSCAINLKLSLRTDHKKFTMDSNFHIYRTSISNNRCTDNSSAFLWWKSCTTGMSCFTVTVYKTHWLTKGRTRLWCADFMPNSIILLYDTVLWKDTPFQHHHLSSSSISYKERSFVRLFWRIAYEAGMNTKMPSSLTSRKTLSGEGCCSSLAVKISLRIHFFPLSNNS